MNTQTAQDAKIIKASLELQNKVGTGNIEDHKVKIAQKVINENKVDFAPLAKPHLDELHRLVTTIATSRGDLSDREILQALMLPRGRSGFCVMC